MTDPEDRKLARWHATRDGALYVCPHCWAGTKHAGRCQECRRFDVRAIVRPSPTPSLAPVPSLSARARSFEAKLAALRKEPKRGRRARDSAF